MVKGKIITIQGKNTAVIDVGMEDGLIPKMVLLTVKTEEIKSKDEKKKYNHFLNAVKIVECFPNKSIIRPLHDETSLKVGQEVFSKLSVFKKQ